MRDRRGRQGEGDKERETRRGRQGEGDKERETRRGRQGEGDKERETRRGRQGEGDKERETRRGRQEETTKEEYILEMHIHVHIIGSFNVFFSSTHLQCTLYMYMLYCIHVHVQVTALGVLCCFALFACLTLLASFFLPSHLSFKNMYM